MNPSISADVLDSEVIYPVVFFLIAAASADLAFGRFARQTAHFAEPVFVIFLILFALALDFRRRRR
ncbi:DUF1328 domain-containing protein [Paraburkholderia tagetis]|uniref:DUF1328 domain-containing protein n=1 Tax=Paraburkholderia tagetis TaxID=2913261 RepID=A0A9X1RMR2_9BURK|nr:DUF1328 domain-containing protein [Paraburkholderia tagetis]MCG5075151.1 DUF1328 domain-containing protein [Paraburkholderia tagetis]